MKKYTVYHIPGIKVGCTSRFSERCKENRSKYGKDIDIKVVLETDDIDEADELEEFCNQEAGYKGQHQSYKKMQTMYSSKKHVSNSQETRDKISRAHMGSTPWNVNVRGQEYLDTFSEQGMINSKRSWKKKGMVSAIDTRTDTRISISKEDFDAYDYYVGQTVGRAPTQAEREAKGKSVSQFTKDGTFIRSFATQTEAALAVGMTPGNLSSCLTGRSKTAGGFTWERE